MKKALQQLTKSERREHKNRPRMKMSGKSLRRPSKFSGMKLARSK
jgi:hypothetical protein